MKRIPQYHPVALICGILLLFPWSCERSSGTTNSATNTTSEETTETPEEAARANSKQAESDLKASDKGKDEDGEPVWKQEAAEFFDRVKHHDNRTFKLPTTWAKKFISDAYKAGTEKIWVVQISKFEIESVKVNISDNMVVVLPKDAKKREAIFALYNKSLKDSDEDPIKDVGQPYISIISD